jgi:hypothetical protein
VVERSRFNPESLTKAENGDICYTGNLLKFSKKSGRTSLHGTTDLCWRTKTRRSNVLIAATGFL